MDLPPQHALLAHEPVGLPKRLRDRIVLARKATDEQLDIADRLEHSLPLRGGDLCLVPIEHCRDVFVDGGMASESEVGRWRCEASHLTAVGLEVTVLGMPLITIEGMLGARRGYRRVGAHL